MARPYEAQCLDAVGTKEFSGIKIGEGESVACGRIANGIPAAWVLVDHLPSPAIYELGNLLHICMDTSMHWHCTVGIARRPRSPLLLTNNECSLFGLNPDTSPHPEHASCSLTVAWIVNQEIDFRFRFRSIAMNTACIGESFTAAGRPHHEAHAWKPTTAHGMQVSKRVSIVLRAQIWLSHSCYGG